MNYFSRCREINHLKNRRSNIMNLKKIYFFFTGLAIISGLIAFGIVKYKTELTDPTDQLSQTPPRVPPALQLAAGSGKVVQKLDAGSYTYIRLDDGTGNETWAAVPKTQLEIGEQIALKGGLRCRRQPWPAPMSLGPESPLTAQPHNPAAEVAA
jgi:hypothetical protein